MTRTDNRIYLDYAATTPVDQSVVDAMKPYQKEIFGNPASTHSFGQEARAAVEQAREDIARHIGANSDEIIFTGGGTESNNLAIQRTAFRNRNKGNHIVTSAIEHRSVLNCCRFLEHAGFRVTYVGVGADGIVDPDDVNRAIDDDTILVSVMHANNKIGSIQPIGEIGKIAHNVNVSFQYIDGESLIVGLDMTGVACSTGSACSFATLEPSHVLLAIGVGLVAAQSAVRFSLGRHTTKNEINRVLDILPGITERMREASLF